MFHAQNIALHQALLKEAEDKIALDPALAQKLLLGGTALGGAALGGTAAHYVTKAHDDKERRKTRNHAFGAGVAAGVAGPKVIKGLYALAQRSGLAPDNGSDQ